MWWNWQRQRWPILSGSSASSLASRAQVCVAEYMCGGAQCNTRGCGPIGRLLTSFSSLKPAVAITYCHCDAANSNLPLLHHHHVAAAGEARTAAMVADAGGEDAEFATFVEPAGATLHYVITCHHMGIASATQPAPPALHPQRSLGPRLAGSALRQICRSSGWTPSTTIFLCCVRAGLIMQKLIEDHLPVAAPERASLLRRAKDMKLPENPLVRLCGRQPPCEMDSAHRARIIHKSMPCAPRTRNLQ